MKERKCRSIVVNTVHDSLALDYHPDEREWLEHKVVDVMENVPKYAKDFMPGLDFSWLKVPLKADVDYGSHYGIHGWHEPVNCNSCNSLMMLDDNYQLLKPGNVLEYDCAGCGTSKVLEFDSLQYNTDNARALKVSYALRGRLGGYEIQQHTQERHPVLRP